MDIVAAVDFSEATDAVVAQASQLAEAFGGKLWLIHSAPPEPYFVGYQVGPENVRDAVAKERREEHQKLQKLSDSLRKKGLEVTALLVCGEPGAKVVSETKRLKAGFIVIGSHGHGALYHLLVGSVCEEVLDQSPCPVVVVPAKEPSQT